MNRTTLTTLIALVAAASMAPTMALAERDNSFSRDRQDQTRSEQRDSRRDDANRAQSARQNPQRDNQRNANRQQTERPVVEQQRRVTNPHRPTPRAEQRSVRQRANDRRNGLTPSHDKRRDVEHRRTLQPERRDIDHQRTPAPRRHVEIHRYRVEPGHAYREHYVYRPVPRDRYYFGIHIYRHYGHRYPGFGFYYSDHDAMRFLAFTTLTLAIIDHVDEHAQRLHEQALIRATTAGVGDTVYWEGRYSHGSVTVEDIWYDNRGRECRELEQSVTSRGITESSHGTVCKKPDGIWVVRVR